MRLTHTTKLKNLKSIRQYGLLKSFSRQGRVAVWLHTAKLDKWGEAHVKVRHGWENCDIVHIVVDVPRSWVRKHANGLYYCDRDIPPARFRSIRSVVSVETVLPLE